MLVAMLLGVLVISGVTGYYQSVVASRNQAIAMAAMNEDGQFLIDLLARQITIAGFNPIQPSFTQTGSPSISFRHPKLGPAGTATLSIFGCSGAFSNAVGTNSQPVANSIGELTCNPNSGQSGSIAVTYEATPFNTVAQQATPSIPTDCQGTPLQQQAWYQADGTLGGNYYYAENRFFLKNDALHCSGNGQSAPSAARFSSSKSLVNHVQGLTFSFGLKGTELSNNPGSILGYVDASQIGNASGIDSAAVTELAGMSAFQRWSQVGTVRICATLKTKQSIYSVPQPYMGCDFTANAVTPPDRHGYRAFSTTVLLRNGG